MNQIIVIKKIKKGYVRFFKTQFVLSILMLIILSFYFLLKWKEKNEMQIISQNINKAFAVESLYKSDKVYSKVELTKEKYFGKITIPKIEIEYSIFNECDDEKLKILPCKFYGVGLGELGNVCIAGHNYNDDRFFSKLNKLEVGDTIYLSSLNGKNYKYIVYDKYKVNSNNFECLQAKRKYDLTLLTCDNVNNKRLIVKASRN